MTLSEADDLTSEDDIIYGQIYSAILEQKLLPGTKLKEDYLCKIYDVGRSRIRKILARLVRDKVVTLIANRGAFVSKPTIEEAREVFAARRLIEGHLVRILADNQDPRCRKVLENHVRLEKGARDSCDFASSIREAGEFHLSLADLANSTIIREFLRQLISMTSLISAAYERGIKADCELDEHSNLINCILEGRADDAVRLMTSHLDGIESRLDLTPPRAPQAKLQDILGVS